MPGARRDAWPAKRRGRTRTMELEAPWEADEMEERTVTARRVISMGNTDPQAFVCRGEWVVAAGSTDRMRAEFPAAELVDFGDSIIVPGFNDAHQHPTICAEQRLQVDLRPERVRCTEDVRTALLERAARTPRGQWVVGRGYDHFRSNGGVELTRSDLDEALPDHPVLVVHVTLHAGVVNSHGLKLAGLTDESAPPNGGELGRDAAGRLTGVLHDQALYDLAFPAFTQRSTVVPPQATSDLIGAFVEYADEQHAAGITSVGDALVGPDSWELLRGLEARGQLTLRVNALAAYEHLDYFQALRLADPPPTARLRLGGVKAFADGAVNGGTCLVEEPIEGTDSHGIARVSAAQLNEIVRRIHDTGLRACVHANGDRAIRYVLDAIESADAANPRQDARHRIEHCSLLTDELIARMRRHHAVAVPFGCYVIAHGDKLARYYGLRRLERMFAHRTLLDAGIAVAGSSDHPCGPYQPLMALQSCVTRQAPDGKPFGPSQRITAREALALYTTGSAYASAEERVKGKLTPGHLADFTVLEDDPLTTPPERLSDIQVRETWVGGRRVFSAA